MKSINLLVIVIVLLFTSCAVTDLPRSTEVDKILMLKTGMTLKDVSKTLETKPYEVLLIRNDTMILQYNYKHYFNDVDDDIELKNQDPIYLMYVNNKLHTVISKEGLKRLKETYMIKGEE